MKIKSIFVAAALAGASHASATVLFAENFQTSLAQFGTNLSGVIVASPDGVGNALAFTSPGSGGDIFTANTISSASGNFHISFDYLGTCGVASCGGFLGFNNPAETWLAGSGFYATPHVLVETGVWQTVAFDFFSATPITLKLEDFNSAADNGTPGNAYFRNLVLTDGVPEPTSWALLVTGFALVGAAARRRKAVVTA